MARVSADTLKTNANAGKAPAADPQRRGRRPTNGNPAQAARQPDLPEMDSPGVNEDEPQPVEPEEADTEETPIPEPAPAPSPAPAARRTRAAAAASAPDPEQQDLIALGKLTRFALENGLTVEDCAERFRAMVEAFDRIRGA